MVNDTYQRLWLARLYIDASFDQPINLNLVAAHAGFSRFHFLRLFQRAFGLTPHQYLINRRMAQARLLLRSGEYSITDVCYQIGFESLGSFSSLFHRNVGVPPNHYRRKMIGGIAIPHITPVPMCYSYMFGFIAYG